MKGISLDKIISIEARKHDIGEAMAAPNLAPEEFVRLSKEYAAVEPVAAAAREVRRLRAEPGPPFAQLAVLGRQAGVDTTRAKLAAFAARPEIAGVVVELPVVTGEEASTLQAEADPKRAT